MIESICMIDSKKPDIEKDKSDGYLDLPDCPDFISLPPEISLVDNIILCEEMLEIWNRNRYFESVILTEDFYL